MKRSSWPGRGWTAAALSAFALALAWGAVSQAEKIDGPGGSAPGTVAAAGAVPPGSKPKPKIYGDGPAHQALGSLPMQHMGRVKPFDTVAREEAKLIYGREAIEIRDAEGDPVERWLPVAAVFDWSVRPDVWDEQAFILAEYLPLKRMIFDKAIRAKIDDALKASGLSSDDRRALESFKDDPDLMPEDLALAASFDGLSDEQRQGLNEVAAKLNAGQKWVRPMDLEKALIPVEAESLDDKGNPTKVRRELAFLDWARELSDKSRRASMAAPDSKAAKLTTVEDRALEAFNRFFHYQMLRDRSSHRDGSLTIIPRPASEAYLQFTAETYRQVAAEQRPPSSALRTDAYVAFQTFLTSIADDKELGPPHGDEHDSQWNEEMLAWMREFKFDEAIAGSAWLPLDVVLKTDASEMVKAGISGDKLAKFREAFAAVEQSAEASPGQLDAGMAKTLLASARALGESVENGYPDERIIALETTYNTSAPFYRAPMAYGFGLLSLILCSIFYGLAGPNRETGGASRSTARALYVLGMLGFLCGIGLETMGFALRIAISGWAPITNMYETVVWVGLATAVIGLIFELRWRKVYLATAACGVAFAATLVAANTTAVLDPDIKSLNPVLRSNLWLTIHVMTIVSSYAAFALALGLGLIAVGRYLTAIYRRDVGYGELAAPMIAGVPLLLAGAGLGYASFHDVGPAFLHGDGMYYLGAAIGILGGSAAAVTLFGWVGEAVSRAMIRRDSAFSALDHSQTTDLFESSSEPPAGPLSAQDVIARARAKSGATPAQLDARGLSMRESAAKIKPLADFVYRAMQIGVLLVAAGTFLGGVWADYSWGRFWGWDPKEVWALITLLVYLIPLHGRFAGWIGTFGLSFSSVLCFSSVLMSWYGVNFVLGVGLHSYGFSEGGGQLTVAASAAGIASIAFAAGWRRMLSYR